MLTLCGCSAQLASAPPESILGTVGDASQIHAWNITGAIAAKRENKAWSASLSWVQKDASHYLIRLFGPLNSGHVLLEKNGSTVTYQDGKKSLQANDAETLIFNETGLKLPLNALSYWIRGLAIPGVQATQRYDAKGLLAEIIQKKYHVSYKSYTMVNEYHLPSKLQLTGPDGQVRLIIKKWQF